MENLPRQRQLQYTFEVNLKWLIRYHRFFQTITEMVWDNP